MTAETQALLGQISKGKSCTVTASPQESFGRGYASACWTNICSLLGQSMKVLQCISTSPCCPGDFVPRSEHSGYGTTDNMSDGQTRCQEKQRGECCTEQHSAASANATKEGSTVGFHTLDTCRTREPDIQISQERTSQRNSSKYKTQRQRTLWQA